MKLLLTFNSILVVIFQFFTSFRKLCFDLFFEFIFINFCYTQSQAVKPVIIFYRA